MVETPRREIPTSIDKALDVCEVLAGARDGMSLTDLSTAVGLPRPSVHRLLSVLRRRGFVRQDEDTQRYSLSLKMLDLSFRLLGRSELRLHAFTVMRDQALGYQHVRMFVALPAHEEVTYAWSAGGDEPAMRATFGKSMPAHCSVYFDTAGGTRRLSCLRLEALAEGGVSRTSPARFGSPESDGVQRMYCTCAPVCDYTGREVARVGVFGHGPDDTPIVTDHAQGVMNLGRLISTRLGFLPQPGGDQH